RFERRHWRNGRSGRPQAGYLEGSRRSFRAKGEGTCGDPVAAAMRSRRRLAETCQLLMATASLSCKSFENIRLRTYLRFRRTEGLAAITTGGGPSDAAGRGGRSCRRRLRRRRRPASGATEIGAERRSND